MRRTRKAAMQGSPAERETGLNTEQAERYSNQPLFPIFSLVLVSSVFSVFSVFSVAPL